LTTPVTKAEDMVHYKSVWYFDANGAKFKQNISEVGQTVFANSFEEIVENNLEPINSWIPGFIDTRYEQNDWRTTYKTYTGMWSTTKGKRLEKILMNCKNHCWDCHECERPFGMEDIDSALQIRKVK
jgi:hypothetical protein